MQQLLLCFIFIGLGVGLKHNQKNAKARFERAKTAGILFSDQAQGKSFQYLQKVQLGTAGLLALYLLVSVFVPLSQKPILILLLVFLGSYYAMHYFADKAWFFDKQGLWTSHVNGFIGFENIVGYEWRVYKNELILRVRYKGRGIMLITCDLVVRSDKKEAVAKVLDERMAGI